MHFLQTTFQLDEIGKLYFFLYQKCAATFQSIQFVALSSKCKRCTTAV